MNRAEDQSTVAVRIATVEDAAAISSVLREAFAEYEALYTAGGYAATTPTADQIRLRWSEGPVWVAQQHNLIVGTIAVVQMGQSLYLRSTGILPTSRGQGAGRLLLEQVESFAMRQGFKRMFLSTTPFLHRAIRLYERFGFERTSEGPYELQETPLFTMEKRLDSDFPEYDSRNCRPVRD